MTGREWLDRKRRTGFNTTALNPLRNDVDVGAGCCDSGYVVLRRTGSRHVPDRRHPAIMFPKRIWISCVGNRGSVSYHHGILQTIVLPYCLSRMSSPCMLPQVLRLPVNLSKATCWCDTSHRCFRCRPIETDIQHKNIREMVRTYCPISNRSNTGRWRPTNEEDGPETIPDRHNICLVRCRSKC